MRRLSAVAAAMLACVTVGLFERGLRSGDWRVLGFGIVAFMLAGGALLVTVGPVVDAGD